ncbi:hypothetical protein NPIL_289121 [Nephila pilipes]|uniref:Uncharacterized protein n=1 Tax=Nephila pilipes TaxID=299642 RepID=A0A8X6NQR9_NEPPI|nr:hypothetical protein NPIL_289121 [Nephila pilipes]
MTPPDKGFGWKQPVVGFGETPPEQRICGFERNQPSRLFVRSSLFSIRAISVAIYTGEGLNVQECNEIFDLSRRICVC